MQGLKAELLRGFWYMALPGKHLRPGKVLVRKMLGEPVLIGRTNDGKVFAISDLCPHRGMPLHHGWFDGDTVACCYHAWRFDRTGTCVEIPSMMPDQQIDLSKIRCGSYPCVERQGIIWVYFARDNEAPSGLTAEPPKVPQFDDDVPPQIYIGVPFPASIDHTFYGTIDPGHVAYVHTSRWFRAKSHIVKAKEKHFEPVELGFKMAQHVVPPEQTAYKLLGRRVTADITYRLPGVRSEELCGDRLSIVGFTAVTPVTDTESILHQMFWTTTKWTRLLRPLIAYAGKSFIKQDRDIAARQREGLMYEPKLMLINDANTQARWWMQLKTEWLASGHEKRSFVNPLKPMTLRWRS